LAGRVCGRIGSETFACDCKTRGTLCITKVLGPGPKLRLAWHGIHIHIHIHIHVYLSKEAAWHWHTPWNGGRKLNGNTNRGSSSSSRNWLQLALLHWSLAWHLAPTFTLFQTTALVGVYYLVRLCGSQWCVFDSKFSTAMFRMYLGQAFHKIIHTWHGNGLSRGKCKSARIVLFRKTFPARSSNFMSKQLKNFLLTRQFD